MPAKRLNMHLTRVVARQGNDPSKPKEAMPIPPSRRITGGIRNFLRQIWSKRHLTKWKFKKSPSKKEDTAVEVDGLGELSIPPRGSFSEMLQLSLLDSSVPRLSLLEECRRSLGRSISIDLPSEPSEPEGETDVISEREKTLRIIEQPREEPVMGSFDFQHSTWGRRRPFQLYTESLAEARRFAEFQRQLEDRLAVNLALCFGVWQNITSQLITEACEPADDERPTKPFIPEALASVKEPSRNGDITVRSALQKSATSQSSGAGVGTSLRVEEQDYPDRWQIASSHGNPAIKDPRPPVGYDIDFLRLQRPPRPQSSQSTGEKYPPIASVKGHHQERRASAPCPTRSGAGGIKVGTSSDSHLRPDGARRAEKFGVDYGTTV
ncbi:hypothetical protein Daesc_003767 [Daldinia eschscholtzii]|uniref:Uncharacterized protein n=1 Tax=Daldinia eschscholtzii TaxID=292717 RepID=A0AAX6MMD4_9PEZI